MPDMIRHVADRGGLVGSPHCTEARTPRELSDDVLDLSGAKLPVLLSRKDMHVKMCLARWMQSSLKHHGNTLSPLVMRASLLA